MERQQGKIKPWKKAATAGAIVVTGLLGTSEVGRLLTNEAQPVAVSEQDIQSVVNEVEQKIENHELVECAVGKAVVFTDENIPGRTSVLLQPLVSSNGDFYVYRNAETGKLDAVHRQDTATYLRGGDIRYAHITGLCKIETEAVVGTSQVVSLTNSSENDLTTSLGVMDYKGRHSSVAELHVLPDLTVATQLLQSQDFKQVTPPEIGS